jgi:hypothetical protein
MRHGLESAPFFVAIKQKGIDGMTFVNPTFKNFQTLAGILLFVGMPLAQTCKAESVLVTNQPPPHAGWEASQDVPLPPRQTETRFFKADITFTTTASNNVQMAFGSDVDNDGKLPSEETSATVGWDRGAWFILSGDLLQKFTSIPQDASTATNRTLRMSVRLSADGTPIGLSFKDGNGNALAFDGLEGIPSWISPKLWDTAALTARGWATRDEQATFSFVLDGTHIILR